MKERPILFSGPMVRAILDGRKTQTRRLVGLDTLCRSSTPGYDWTWRGQAPIRSVAQQRRHPGGCWQDVGNERLMSLCPHGQPGDRLWVRETWQPVWSTLSPPPHWYDSLEGWDIKYPATDELVEYSHPDRGLTTARKPAIHMPRLFSRIALEVTSVRVERLQDISSTDALAEGIEPYEGCRSHDEASGWDPVSHFEGLWDTINGKRAPWASNPWVWVVSFARITGAQSDAQSATEAITARRF